MDGRAITFGTVDVSYVTVHELSSSSTTWFGNVGLSKMSNLL